jgi:hypothetical protein
MLTIQKREYAKKVGRLGVLGCLENVGVYRE